MGTGWRRAFCTRDPESTIHKHRSQSPTPSPGTCVRFSFLSSSTSNPSTPSLHHSPTTDSATPTSPRSPSLKLFLFKNSFKFRSSCGICLNSVKTGQGTAIYTAECGHAFHSACIASLARGNSTLVCPVCNVTWKDVRLFQQPRHSVLVRSYDDDEPLPSSVTDSTPIGPIPEADESLEDDEENHDTGEFPGFFVNPKPLQRNDADSRSVRVKLMPESVVISVSRSHETYALALRVKAPPPSLSPPHTRRLPMDLVTVLNVCGSMSGAKLHMLKRAMRLVISSLGSSDRLAIVAFSANSKRLLPLKRMTAQGQRAARRVVDLLVCVQGNSVGETEEAVNKATKVLEDRREKNPLSCVLILSDGHEESVQKKKHSNQRRCLSHVSSISTSTRFNFIEIPVHSSGLKPGLVNDPVEDDFAKFVKGILSVVLHDLIIQLGFSAPGEISGVYSCSGGPTVLNPNAARLGDLYTEEEKELLVEVKVPTSALGRNQVMTVRCVYKGSASGDLVYTTEQALTVLPPKSAPLCGGRTERLRNVFITSRAVAESRRMMKHNEFASAHHLLSSARALLLKFGSAQEYVHGLEAELAELQWRKQQQETVVFRQRGGSGNGKEREMNLVDENGEALTPTSAWRAAERLAKMAMMKKSLNRVGDLHGFENARF